MIRVLPYLRQVIASTLFLLVSTISTTSTGKCHTSPQTIAGAQAIDTERLIEFVEQNDSQIIIDSRILYDCIPGYIPVCISLPDTQTRCDLLADLIDEKSGPVMFYCNGPKCRRGDKVVTTAVQ